jgi:peptide/nickel transport system ATP-binding protein
MRTVRGKRISMIFQEPSTSLNPVLTIGEQIIEVLLTHHSISTSEAAVEARTWLEKVGLNDAAARLSQYPFQLSGGQKQRVMIAIALAARPDVLIADEPTTALDVSVQAQVLALLKSLQQSLGMAMLLITHDLGIVSTMADHVALMYAGQIVESAPTEQFFKHPRHPYARALLAALPAERLRGASLSSLSGQVPPLTALPSGCRFASRCGRVEEQCIAHMPKLTPAPVSSDLQALTQALNYSSNSGGDRHTVRCFKPYGEESVGQTNAVDAVQAVEASADHLVIDVCGLNVAYRQKQGLKTREIPIVKNLDLRIFRGRTLALVGESGSGKTTAAKAILQLLSESAVVTGSIQFNGQEVHKAKGKALKHLRQHVQVVFQDPFASLNPRHRVREIIREGLDSLCVELSEADKDQRIAEVLESVSLPQSAALRFPHEFSGGQRQRIAIARALAVRPSVLICDEPTSALDVSVQAQVLNLLRQLQRDTGLAYLFITHNLAVVEYLADDVLVLKAGEMVESGTVEQVLKNPKTEYTRQLLAAIPRVRQLSAI